VAVVVRVLLAVMQAVAQAEVVEMVLPPQSLVHL
jgi:hypothetical protein